MKKKLTKAQRRAISALYGKAVAAAYAEPIEPNPLGPGSGLYVWAHDVVWPGDLEDLAFAFDEFARKCRAIAAERRYPAKWHADRRERVRREKLLRRERKARRGR